MSFFRALQTWCPCARPRRNAATEPAAETEALLAPAPYRPAPVMLPTATVDSLLDTLRRCVVAYSGMIFLSTTSDTRVKRVDTPETLHDTPADPELTARLRAALANS